MKNNNQQQTSSSSSSSSEIESVKEFAKRIGALQEIRLTSADALLLSSLRTNDNNKKKTPSSSSSSSSRKEQHLSFVFVLDFESTCWNDKVQRTQEIIEFSGVLLNLSTGKVVDEFQSYVEPQEQPNLSAFCTQLTGITQSDVASAMPLRYVLRSFKAWIDKNQDQYGLRLVVPGDVEQHDDNNNNNNNKLLKINKTDEELAKKWSSFVTWSDWDLNVCLYYECNRKQIVRPPYLNCWIDLRAVYTDFYRRRPVGLNGALKEVGLHFVGREHCGLDDARNTAILTQKLVEDGCLLSITKFRPLPS